CDCPAPPRETAKDAFAFRGGLGPDLVQPDDLDRPAVRRADVFARREEPDRTDPDVDPAPGGRSRIRDDGFFLRGPHPAEKALTFALAVVPVTLLLLGFPIFLVLLTSACVALVFFMNVPLAVLHQNLVGAIDAYALLAVPFFIYAGELMGRGTVAQRLVDFVQAGVGSVRG